MSRARQIIENIFRILASRFRIFRRAIIDKTGNIKNIIKAAVVLHNFPMRKSTRNMYCQPDYVDQKTSQGLSPGSWRNKATEIQGLIHLRAQGSNNSTRTAKKCKMIPKITSTQNMVNLFGKGKLSRVLQVCLMKLIETNNTYINTYVLSPHDISFI